LPRFRALTSTQFFQVVAIWIFVAEYGLISSGYFYSIVIFCRWQAFHGASDRKYETRKDACLLCGWVL